MLRFVEKTGDRLTLGIAYKNNASSPRPIFLAEGFETSTLLTDAAASVTWPMLAVSGVTGDPTKVGRLKRKTARFTFPYPAGAAEITFSSVWITVWMMNAASPHPRGVPAPPADGVGGCRPAAPSGSPRLRSAAFHAFQLSFPCASR